MPPVELKDTTSTVVQAGKTSFRRLQVDDAASIEVIARLRETQGDVLGRAFFLDLDSIVARLGAKWDAKKDVVHDYLRTSFGQRFQEPNWCAMVGENAWIALTISAGSRTGALKCAEIWYETGQFFVGDVSSETLPLYEVVVEAADSLKLRLIDLRTFFDRDDDFTSHGKVRPQVAPQDEAAIRTPSAVGTMIPLARTSGVYTPGSMASVDMPSAPYTPGSMTAMERGSAPYIPGTMTPMERAAPAGSTLVVAGRNLAIACAVEPVFELKKLSMIGHRMEPTVIDRTGQVQLDAKAMRTMDWNDRERIDLANIEEGLRLLESRSPGQRKILIVVPVAFSTMASSRGRARVTGDVARAAARMGMKVLYEIRELEGVPTHRVVEIVSLTKPYCMTVVAHVGAEPRLIQAVRECGFSGISVTYDGNVRDEAALATYLGDLSVSAKAAVGACMVQGLDNLRQVAVARLAGITHASVKTSALHAGGARP